MEETDKRDCLKDVQEYIKQNVNSTDKETLMQAIEKTIQQNYIPSCDVVEVLTYIGANIWGIHHKGYTDFKGKWHDDSYELELGIWERGSLCCGMISDAIRLLKKKYTYMQSQKVGDSPVLPSDSDAEKLSGVLSSMDSKEKKEQTQLTERESFYFAKAIEKGLMKQTENGYEWLQEKAKKVSLMYFISRIHFDLTTDEIPYRKIEKLFGYTRLDSVYQSYLRTNQNQKWKSNIDDLFL